MSPSVYNPLGLFPLQRVPPSVFDRPHDVPSWYVPRWVSLILYIPPRCVLPSAYNPSVFTSLCACRPQNVPSTVYSPEGIPHSSGYPSQYISLSMEFLSVYPLNIPLPPCVPPLVFTALRMYPSRCVLPSIFIVHRIYRT